MNQPRRILSQDQLITLLYRNDVVVGPKAIDVHIHNICANLAIRSERRSNCCAGSATGSRRLATPGAGHRQTPPVQAALALATDDRGKRDDCSDARCCVGTDCAQTRAWSTRIVLCPLSISSLAVSMPCLLTRSNVNFGSISRPDWRSRSWHPLRRHFMSSAPLGAHPGNGQVATGRLSRARSKPIRRNRTSCRNGQSPCCGVGAVRGASCTIPC